MDWSLEVRKRNEVNNLATVESFTPYSSPERFSLLAQSSSGLTRAKNGLYPTICLRIEFHNNRPATSNESSE